MRRCAVAVLAAGLLAGCGGGSATTAPTMTLDPHPPRAVAPGQTIRITEPGSTRMVGDGMTPLKSFAAARTECGYWHAFYVGEVYGGHMYHFDSIAHAFATHRAAPGYLDTVERGCRAGLHK